jgi:ribosomal protein S27E
MIKCPSCGHENVDGTTFCEMCGEDLQSATGASGADAGSTPAAASGAEIKCPACDNMNPAENVVCEVCGTPLRDDDTAGADVTTAPPPVTTPPPAPVFNDADTTPVSNADAAATNGAASADAAPDSGSTPAAPDVSAAPDIATSPPPGGAVAPGTPAVDAALSSSGATGAGLAPGKVKLVVEQGMTVGKQFVLGDSEMQVGREDADEDIYPDIDLADQDEGYVHRQHATLKFENDQLFVTHLGGANKTRLNNKPIPDNQPQPVALGDKISFGKVVVRVLPL